MKLSWIQCDAEQWIAFVSKGVLLKFGEHAPQIVFVPVDREELAEMAAQVLEKDLTKKGLI